MISIGIWASFVVLLSLTTCLLSRSSKGVVCLKDAISIWNNFWCEGSIETLSQKNICVVIGYWVGYECWEHVCERVLFENEEG